MEDEKEVMERDAPDSLDEKNMEGTTNSAFQPVAKRRKCVVDSDSDTEIGSDYRPSTSEFVDCKLDSIVDATSTKDDVPFRWTSDDRQCEREHEFHDIAEVYGGQLGEMEHHAAAAADDDDEADDDIVKVSGLCAICDDGGHLLICDGPCLRSFHASKETVTGSEPQCRSLRLKAKDYKELETWYCLNCKHGQQQCFICGLLGSSEGEKKEVFICDVALCGRFYHLDCLGRWKQQEGAIKNPSDFIRSVKEGDGFCCPAHNCRRCGKSEEESADKSMKLIKCFRCPKAFHKICLPRRISFQSQGDIPVRAWEIGRRLMMYCLRHDIVKDLLTPSRDHLKWPEVSSLKQKDPKCSGIPLKRNFQKMTQAASLKLRQKHENMHQTSSVNQSFPNLPSLNRNLGTRLKPSPLQHNHPTVQKDPSLKCKTTERGVDGTQCFLGQNRQKTIEGESDRPDEVFGRGQMLYSSTEKELGLVKQSQRDNKKQEKSVEYQADVTRHFAVDQRQKQGTWGQDAVNHIPDEQKDNAMRDRATPAVQGPTVVRTLGLPKIMEPIKKVDEVRLPVKKILISREGQQARISRLMQQAAIQVTLDDVTKILVKPSCYQENREKTFGHRGWIESTLNAGKKAWNLLKNGGIVEDAKRLCTKDSLRQLLRTEKSLEVYLAPLLHGSRYTSFGRHFTRVNKLEKIVDRIHPYIDSGDMVVDFCCGANDFSVLLDKKLRGRGKSCIFRNFDIHPPKDAFCFTQGDWFANDGHDFLDGSRLIIGLNPPFGYMGSLAEKFILHAFKFKPKLLILIVPPETMSYSRSFKDFNYELVWVDDELLSGKAFFIPGSVDGSTNETGNENMLQWNKVTPPLFLWSRGDMIRRHKEIALRCQAIKGSPGYVSGSHGWVPPPSLVPFSTTPGPPDGKCYPVLPVQSVPLPPAPHISGGIATHFGLPGRAPVPRPCQHIRGSRDYVSGSHGWVPPPLPSLVPSFPTPGAPGGKWYPLLPGQSVPLPPPLPPHISGGIATLDVVQGRAPVPPPLGGRAMPLSQGLVFRDPSFLGMESTVTGRNFSRSGGERVAY